MLSVISTSVYSVFNVYGAISGELNRVEADMKKCLVDAYKKSDEEFLKLATQKLVPFDFFIVLV